MSTAEDLLIIGAGHLGRRIGQQWRARHPNAEIIGETRTDASHALLEQSGVSPAIAGTIDRLFPNVAFCMPPSGSSDYPAAVAEATRRVTSDGRFVFTSSTSAHGSAENVTETTPYGTGTRAERLVRAEGAVLELPGGSVVRCTGLCLIDRGPHTYWLGRGSVPGSADAPVNLIHYDDAAAAVVSALGLKPLPEPRTFLACAQRSLTKRQIIETVLRHPRFEGAAMPVFVDDEPPAKRAYDNSWTREVLNWKPQFESFEEFIEFDAARERAGAALER